MKSFKGIITILVIFVGVVVFKSSFFIVYEGRQAIITEFGKPVGKPITEAGYNFKKPFFQQVRYVDKRMLYWDGKPNQIPTKDKKYIKVDTTGRWKIVDTLKFIQTLRNEKLAEFRLGSIIDSATRNIISKHNLAECVRNSNSILDKITAKKEEIKKRRASGEKVIEDEVTGEVEKVLLGREELSKLIVEKADKGLAQFGIKLVDVQLRRISYEKTVEAKVYERMISEREKIAQKIRSIGQGERAKIEGRIQKDLKNIESLAYRKAQGIRGKAEATSIAIYAKALSKDPSFYEFTKSMDAYKSALSNKAKFLLSSDTEFLKYLKKVK